MNNEIERKEDLRVLRKVAKNWPEWKLDWPMILINRGHNAQDVREFIESLQRPSRFKRLMIKAKKLLIAIHDTIAPLK